MPPDRRRRVCAHRSRSRRAISSSGTRSRGACREAIVEDAPLIIGKMLTSSGALPTSKSLKSCAGVILTAPEPISGSAYSSATIGIRRPTSGRIARAFPRTRSRVALVVGMHGHAGVAEHRLRPRRRHDDETCPSDGLRCRTLARHRLRVAQVPEVATSRSRPSDLRSEMAVWNFGSQLTRRLSR